MNIRQDLVSKDKYSLKCPYSLTPKYIVIHNTSAVHDSPDSD